MGNNDGSWDIKPDGMSVKLLKTICVLVISALLLAAAQAFDPSKTAADLARKIKPQLPAGWSISVEKNTITVTRQKPVEWYGTISLPYHESKADLKKRGFVQSSTYTITVKVGPPMTAEGVAKLVKENDRVVDDYYSKHPADPRGKSIGPPEAVTEKLHPIPDVLTKDFSAVVTPFIQGWMAFYSEEDEKECRDVEREVRRVLAGRRGVASDPIDRLVFRLSSNPLWQNGRAPGIRLPQDASAEQVVAEAFKMTGFDQGRVTKHRILEAKQVRIRPGSDEYTAALVETNLGEKIVLFRFMGGALGWWSRVFSVEAPVDAELQAERPALRLRIGVPERGIVVANDDRSHFHVVIENASDSPQKIIDEWNSWGYFNLRFEYVTPAGEKKTMEKLGREWSKNFLTMMTLAPGEVTVWDVYLNGTIWSNLPVPEQGEAKVRLRAIFEQKAEKGVDAWHGRITSPEEEITFRNSRPQR